jgi:zona occludens toxin
MSIFAYVGLPGSGKSYDVVANQIIPALKRGRRVVTNVPLKRDAVRNVTPKGEIVEFPTEAIQSDPALIDEYATAGSVIILDEVWRLFPAGQKVDRVPEPFKKLLAEHRHMVNSKGQSVQIVLVTQDLSQIGMFARQLVEMTFFHTKLSTVGAKGSYRIDVVHGMVTGQQVPESRRINRIFGRYKAEVFACYQSHTMSDSAIDGADENALDPRGNVWLRPSIAFGALFVCVATWYGVAALAGFFAPDESAASVASAGVIEDASPAVVVTGTRRDPESRIGASLPVRNQTAQDDRAPIRYRVVGHIHDADDGWGLIDLDGFIVRVPWSSCYEPGDGRTICQFDGHEVTEISSRRAQ